MKDAYTLNTQTMLSETHIELKGFGAIERVIACLRQPQQLRQLQTRLQI